MTKGESIAIKNETKEQRSRFLRIFLVTLSVSLFGNMLAGNEVIRAGEGVIRACQDLSCHLFL